MNALLMKMLAPYMDTESGGDATGGGGGGTIDRGDNLDPTAGMSEEDKAAAEAQAEADLKALKSDDKGGGGGGGGEDKGSDEDKPARGEDGKFTKKDKDAAIPKTRFDEAVSKEREAREAAERRAAELEAKLKKEEQSVEVQKLEDKVDDLEKQHAKLIMDGEHEKAAAVMKEIRMTERSIARMESEEKTSAATAQAVEQVRFDAAVAKLESDYPQFNPESEEFNLKLVNLALAEQRRLMAEERLSPSQALLRAGKDVMELINPTSKENPEAKGLGAAQRNADRKATQVDKNLDTSKRQPASTKDAGLDSDKAGDKGGLPDVKKMSASEWAALPESTKAKLRGDQV